MNWRTVRDVYAITCTMLMTGIIGAALLDGVVWCYHALQRCSLR